MAERVVAVLGTRFEDLRVEEETLGPLGVTLRAAPGHDADEVVRTAADAEVVMAGSAPRFDESVLDRLRCRGIVRYGIGTDSIDLHHARRRRIWVARVSDYGTEAVAFHALTLALAGARRLVQADDHVRGGGWGFAELRPLHLPSASVAGIVGYGRIGRRLGEMLSCIGYRVLVHDPLVDDVGEGVERVDTLEDLLGRADIVSLHVPGAPDGSPLLTSDELAQCRPGSVLVNTARGSLIDRRDLVAALRTGRPGVAALDVHDEEPVDPSGFADVADRVVLTPHMAWYSVESEQDLRRKAAQEAARILRGERPLDVVVDPTEETEP